MKRKFILLAMMLLTLIGGVNLNVLNAKETIEIGEGSTTPTGTSYLNVYPFSIYYNYSMSQQIYTAEELGNIGNADFKTVSFKFYTNNNIGSVRSVEVYMKNVTKDDFSYTQGSGGNLVSTDWISITVDDMVYSGDFTIAGKDNWIELTFTKDFNYVEGMNLMLCVVDKTGSYCDGVTRFYGYETEGNRCLTMSRDNTPFSISDNSVQGYVYTKNNQVRFTWEPSAPSVMPSSVPEITSIEATHNSVTLSWNAVENAKKYNVYTSTGDLVNTVNATSYTIEGLEELTEYCYQVSAVNGEYETEKSATRCATTLETPADPLVGKQFRLRALTYNKKYSNYYYGPYDFYSAKYLYIDNYNAAGLKVIDKVDSNAQRFTFEPTGVVEGQYYLRSADGYYINCGEWDVSAYDESQKSPIEVVYLDDTQTQFYLTNGTGRHFKVETDYYETQPYVPYCDAAQQYAAKWIVEEVAFTATATTGSNSIYDDQTTTLSVTAMDGSGNYTYSWSTAEDLSYATSANPTFTPSTTGEHTFTCTVTDTESGSTAEASVTVYVNARPALQLAVSADKELIYNDGETAVLTATATEGYAPYTYSWTLNETEVGTEATYTFSNTTVGEYTLTCTVTDARNNIVTDSKTITVKDLSEKPLVIELGTESTNTYGFLPTYTYYNYSLTQQIYTQSEINMSNNVVITSIAFKESAGVETTRNFSIYMQNTSETTCNTSSFIIQDKACFEGNVTFKPYEWVEITLETPFEYDATKNILLCVDDNTGSYINYRSFATYNTTTENSNYIYNDNTNYDPLTSSYGCYTVGQKNSIKFGYEIPAPKPESLVATPAQIHVGETTTLTWNELEGAESYNIYVDGVLNDNTEELTYELSGLTYNLEPGHTIEVAAVYADATESGKASVTVQVGGAFTIEVIVTDGTNYIENAEVYVDITYAYDEFFNKLEIEVEPAITNEQGFANVTLPLLAKYYDEYDGMWITPYYTVKASKAPYSNAEDNVYCAYISNLQTVERTLVLTLPMVDYIQVQDEEGNDLNGDVMEGTNVVLSWDAVEGADSYKVYTLVEDVEIKSETTIDPKYFVEGVEKGYRYAVSALFGDLESEKCYASLTVKGIGYFKGYVTDGTNALKGIQVKVSSEYGDASAVVTTDEEGYFNGEIMEGDNYILTISHSDYDEFISTPFPIVYQTEYDFETIELNAKPSSDVTSVTATVNGDNVDVEWTVEEATKYNVYRRLASAQDCGEMIAEEIEGTTYTDTQWTTVAPGTYQYGVAALVEPQAQTRGTKVIFEEGFENNGTNIPTGWTKSGSAGVLNSNEYYNSGIYGCYLGGTTTNSTLTSPEIDLTSYSSATWSFYYWSDSDLSVKIKVKDGEWNLIQTYPYRTTFEKIEIALSEDYVGKVIQIQFEHKTAWTYTALDDILIVSESSEVETQIVWSDEVVKQGPATFIGGDTENPTAWNVDANWSTGSVPADGAEVTINANAVISSAVNVSNVTINAGTSLTVANGGALTVTGTISQASNYLLVLEEGGQIFQNNNNVTARFRMSIDNPTDWSDEANKDGWQFISMPFNDALYSDFAGTYNPSTGQNTCDYDLYKYDGSQDLEWLNYRENDWYEDKFMSGYGYLASRKEVSTVNMYGTLNVANPFAYRQYAYSAEKPLVNFHLVGNPFSHDINWTDFTISGTYFDSESGSVLENIQYFVDGYAIVDNNGNYQYYTSADNEPIKVGQGFFIKTLKNKVNLGYTPKRSAKSSSNNSLNITATGNAGKDNVVINLAGKSEGFDKLQNFNDAIATVYVAEDGKNYGIYNCDADVQEVELSFNANQMGNYTISIEPNGKFQTVTLVDRFTGIETNMLVEDYHFTAMSNVNTNRFIIKMVNGQQTTDNSHFVYQSGEDLIIDAEGTVQIIDVMGRVLVSDEVESTNNRINVSGFQNGTYMVRVINGSEVKVEKVVIY